MPKREQLRASDADRDQIIDRLRHAAAEGRLAVHELEHRVSCALKARSYADLDATVRDLPGSPVGARRRGAPHAAIGTVRAHPALILLAIPLALAAVVTVAAMALLWSLSVLVVFLLAHRRHRLRHPHAHRASYRFEPIQDRHEARRRYRQQQR